MRVGFNPNKDKILPKSDYVHQVIVPVYIPHQDDYFKDSFQILQLCLESLFKTSHDKTYITIVNNGSCDEVVTYLNRLFVDNKIQEVIHTINIGYINAMLKGTSGQNFAFFTTADSDVLFLNDWQIKSYELFENFPKVGAVSPSPNSRVLRYFTSNVLFDNVFTKKVKFTKNVDPNSMLAFAKSIGNEFFFNEVNLSKCLTIENSGTRALIGAGHFIVTYRSEIFDSIKERYTNFLLGGNSDFIFDKKVVDKGFWRLSTEKNYAYHMGNIKEEWMFRMAASLHHTIDEVNVPKLKKHKRNIFLDWFKISIFSRLIFRRPFWQLYLRYKGLTPEEANQYLR